LIRNIAASAFFVLQSLSALLSAQTSPEWKPVEAAMGRAGKVQRDGALKFAVPRRDLTVVVDGIAVRPGLALGAWVAFSPDGEYTMMMGDLVLLEGEVAPVMAKLQQGGIEITALHNHVLHESPRIMYMHIGGHGNAVRLADAIHQALAATGTPPETPPGSPQKLDLDSAKLDEAMGRKGTDNGGGVYQFAVPRAEPINEHGRTVPPSMGVATAINFQPTGGGKAAITGDFVLRGSEVNPVIEALRENGIEVTAVHSHMLDEEPRLFFMHFWAYGDAVKLASGVNAALGKTNSQK
jgi:hypothetical protein